VQTDHIDLYQIHRPSPDTDIEETLSALTDLVRAGKVRAIGSSTFPASEIVQAQWIAERRALARFRTEHPPYSILGRAIERKVLPTCQKYGMGVLVWSPLAKGMLSGKYRKAAPQPDAARAKMFPKQWSDERNLDAVERLIPIAQDARIVADPHGHGLCHGASRGDLGNHRPTDDATFAGFVSRRRGAPQ
jgi:aryl-alcohol dehydrogenase-like predicted oxidoreductase